MRAADGFVLISVVIPVYERPDLVDRAIDSVLAQILPPGITLELIVVDDGSSGETHARLLEWCNRDARVRIRSIPHCGMPGAVRNRGVEKARGSLLAFLDSDDAWDPEKIAVQTTFHGDRGSEVRISHTRERWIRNDREVSQASQRHRRAGALFHDSLRKCIIGPSTVMIDRNLYIEHGGFREDLEIAEDYELWLRITAGERVGYVDRPLTTKYAGHGDQLSERYGEIERFRIAALQPLVENRWFEMNRPDEMGIEGSGVGAQRLAADELARKCRVYAKGARKRGRQADAALYNAIADRWSPL